MKDLLEPEFRDSWLAWKKTRKPGAADAFLEAIRPVLSSAVRAYASQPTPTIFSQAKSMALDAADRYDPKKSKLRTHLMYQLQGLRRLSAEEGNVFAVSEQTRLDASRLRRAEEELRDTLGRDPSVQELADHAGMSVRRVERVLSVPHPVAEGSLLEAGDDENNSRALQPPVTQLARRGDAALRFVYQDLDPRDQFILEHSLGLFGRPVLSRSAIAAKLGLSVSAVSRRAAAIQQRLNAVESSALLS